MTFTEFMGILNGEYKETAGTNAKNQCVDLANAYIKYVLGLPIIEWANAVDFPTKAGDKYEYILNTPTGVPSEGDLVIWGGTYGHIAIFIEGNATRFTSFDENYPTGSPCHVQEHTYLSPKVLGWLHPKESGPGDIQSQLNTCIVDRDTNHNDRMALYEELGFTGLFNRVVAVEKIKMLMSIEQQVKAKDDQLKLAQDTITKLQNESITKETELKTLQDDIQKLNDRVMKAINDNKILQDKLDKAQTATQQPVYMGFKKWIYETFLR